MRFIVPLKKETAASNALVFPVITRGTEKYPTVTAMRKIQKSLYDAGVGGSTWKSGDSQIIAILASFLDKKYAIDDTDIEEGVLCIIEDMLLCPLTENGVFRKESVESEKKLMADSVRAKVNNKGVYAKMRCEEIMFASEPFGVKETGDISDIESATPESVYRAYKDILSRGRIEILVCGSTDEEKFTSRMTGIVSKLERGEIYDTVNNVTREVTGEIKKVYERQNVTQGKLVLGYRTGSASCDEDYFVTKVTNEIFGGSPSSKLFMNVREKLSLCYYCSSGLNGDKGAMFVSSGIEFKNEQKTVDEINVQLEKMKSGDITDTEINDAVKSCKDGLLRVSDSRRSLIGWYFARIIDGKIYSPEDVLCKYDTVTRELIVEKAKKIQLDTYYFLCGEEASK